MPDDMPSPQHGYIQYKEEMWLGHQQFLADFLSCIPSAAGKYEVPSMLMGLPPQSTVLWIVHPQYPESILHTQVALYHPESSTSWHSSVGHSAAVQPMVSLGSTTHKEQSISTVASCSSLGSPTHEDMAIIFTVNSQGSTIPGTFSEQSATLELKSLVSCIHEVPAVTPLNCQGSSLP